MTVELKRFQMRRGTPALWASRNPILAEGEEGYETDTGRRKVGDGITRWNDLPYASDPVANLHDAPGLGLFFPEAHGGIADGSTDCSDAVDAALTAAQAAGGGSVYLGPGIYAISRWHTIPNKVAIIGAGEDVTTLKTTDGGAGVGFGVGGGSSSTSYRASRSGYFTVDGNNVGGAAGPLVLFGAGAGCEFSSIRVKGSAAGGGIKITQTQNAVFTDVWSAANNGWNWTLTDGAGGLTFVRCEFGGAGSPAAASNSGNLLITMTGANTGSGYSDRVANCEFVGCQFEGLSGAPTASIYADTGVNMRFFGGNIVSQPSTSTPHVVFRANGAGQANPASWTFSTTRISGTGSAGSRKGTAFDVNFNMTGLVTMAVNFAGLAAVLNSDNTTFRMTSYGSSVNADAVMTGTAAATLQSWQVIRGVGGDLAGPVGKRPIYAEQAADLTVTNSVSVVNTDLSFPLEPNTTYVGYVVLTYEADTAADAKIDWSLPSGATSLSGGAAISVSAAGATANVTPVPKTDGASRPLGGVGIGTPLSITLNVRIKTGGTAGNAILRFAQNTATGTGSILHATSFGVLTPVT